MRLITLVVAAACLVATTMPSAPAFRVSISVSPFAETVLKTGTRFTDGRITATTAEELERLFVAHGATEVYARISTRQSVVHGAGDHSMDRGLERARLAAKLGLPFNPELGLFDSYGDIRCQPPPDFSDYGIALPGPWASLAIDQMAAALRAYGAAAAKQIVATGARVNIWDLGNEVEFGVAGVAVSPMPGGCDASAGATGEYHAPDAVNRAIGQMSAATLPMMDTARRIDWLKTYLWPSEAKVLAAVAGGIRSIDPRARFSTHVSGISATQPEVAAAFFSAMRDGGFLVDEAGVSYYPTSSRTPANRLQAFKEMAIAMKRAIGRPVFIAEFGYPSAAMSGAFAWNDAVPDYPLSPEGQASFVRDLVAWGRAEGALSGIRPWAPELVVPGWAPMSLFERQGATVTARPALDAFRPVQ